MSIDARDVRHALALVAHELNHQRDWQSTSSREHLELALKAADKALVNAQGGDHLAEAATQLLFALELRERDKFSAQDLRERVNQRRPG